MRLIPPDAFDLEHSEKYRLILRLQPDNYAFALFNPSNNKLFYYQEMAYRKKFSKLENLKEFFFDNSFPVLLYKKLQVLVYSAKFTLVPSILFEEKNEEAFFDFNFHQRSGICLSHFLQQSHVHIVYEMEKDIYDFFHRSLICPEFVPHIAPLTGFFQQKSLSDNNREMVVSLHKDTMDVLCFSHNELLLANNFVARNTDDSLYYILFAWKQLKMDQLKDTLFVIGSKKQKAELIRVLQKYLRNISAFDIDAKKHFAETANDMNIPPDVLMLSLCES
jgi:hypothetical protein